MNVRVLACGIAMACMVLGHCGGSPFKTYNHALVLMETGHMEQAENLLLQSLAETPNDAEAWNQLGIIAFDRTQFDLALERFQNARNYDPLNVAYLNNVALAYMKMESADQGIPVAIRATELDPDSSESWLILATLLLKQGNADQARTALQTSLALDPDNEQAQALMSRLPQTTP